MPIRLEVGPKDLKQGQCVAVRRDTGEKITIPDAHAENRIKLLLEEMQDNMIKRYTCIQIHVMNHQNMQSKQWVF